MARKASKAKTVEMVGSVVVLADAPEGKKGAIARDVPVARIEQLIAEGLARRARVKDFEIAG